MEETGQFIGNEREAAISVISNDPVKTSFFKDILKTRYVFSLMGFLGFANVYAMRVNLSVSIVAMVNSSVTPLDNDTDDSCPFPPESNSTKPNTDGEFLWDESLQGIILGSFFWGYIFTNPVGGRLGEIYGGKRVFAFGVFITSFLTLLTPWAARSSVIFLIILRIIIGLGEGVTFPAYNSMMAKWIPPLERSKTSSMVFTGGHFGIVVSLPICGLLADSSFLGGWPSTFYVFGGLGLIWCIAWMWIIYDSPEVHPTITIKEKEFITSSLRTTHTSALPIPFRDILKSTPFWGTMAAHVGQNWGFYFLLTELPTYMQNILHFEIRENSFLTALPYFMTWIASIAFGNVADSLRSKKHLSTTATRRLFNSIGSYGPMTCLILIGYVGCNAKLIVGLLVLAAGLNAGTFSGYMNSHLDMAPNYAGTLMGFTNCVATIPGFVAPMLVGALVNHQETLTRWRLVFWIAAIIFFVGNTIYICLVSGEEQPWNSKYIPPPDNEEESSRLLGASEEDLVDNESETASRRRDITVEHQ